MSTNPDRHPPAQIRSNFSHLERHDPQLVRLGLLAERYFAEDPNTALIKLRQFGETLAQVVASRVGIYTSTEENQYELLRRLREKGILTQEVHFLFGELRRAGNSANHAGVDDHRTALSTLKTASELAVWFQRIFGDVAFKPGPFVPPSRPKDESAELRAELDRMKGLLDAAVGQHQDSAERLASLETQLHEARDEREVWEQLATETEAAKFELAERLAQIQEGSALLSLPAIADFVQSAREASEGIELDEAGTRRLIDAQLRAAGWEADSVSLVQARGAHPEKGKNKAIAEWSTQGRQAADYVLFAGLVPVAVVEAKRANVDVAGKIHQAERYSRGFPAASDIVAAWKEEGRSAPWPDGQDGTFQIPFAYSCNGRPYRKQLAEKSGTWFRDLRQSSTPSRPLQQFHTPEGLLDLLRRDRALAEERLRVEPFGYLHLRDYQEQAIHAVEAALEHGQRECLLAMATGTGKTRTMVGLMYRFLKAERFKRILFLVDRTALGNQALDTFQDAPLEQSQPLSRIYNVAQLGDMAAEAETRIQVATVQAIVKRVFQSENPPSIDTYDCIVVDEAHRGYTLDQEMTDGELAVRDAAQYLSTYRRVLDYFDAVKVGLTATPAKHTTDIFGKPVYVYSYREAVADDWLIDHEPPIRYTTLLSKNGIQFEKGAVVSAIDTGTGEVETSELDDDLHFDVESFNRAVITEDFNRVICRELAKELDPFGDEKTMIFCATDLHADMVKRLLDESFLEIYGDAYNEAAVRKITGRSDRQAELIKRYKNERHPVIAITVDLLTTGIDVPKICHLVFLRRVRSRILYEQMIGRATRRCDEIGKTVFKIYDPVDIYASLQDVNTMKPLVKDPNIPLGQLLTELADPASAQAPGAIAGATHAHDVLAAISQKIMRILRRAQARAQTAPPLAQKLAELEGLWGVPPERLHKHLSNLGPSDALAFLQQHRQLERQLDEVVELVGSDRKPLIYEGPDELLGRSQLPANEGRPDDYLESFSAFVHQAVNESAALSVVVNRPRDLTRAQLREIRLLLDEKGYSEARLRVAWRRKTNEEIAAGILGYIRLAALGEDLVPFSQRVERAMRKIRALHPWTAGQLNWLDRLAKQLTHEMVIDEAFINDAFATDGGAKTLDLLLGRKLGTVLETLTEALWSAA